MYLGTWTKHVFILIFSFTNSGNFVKKKTLLLEENVSI